MPLSRSTSSKTLHRHRLTTDDYYKMGEAGIITENDRVELIEGEIIDRTPIGSQHAYLLNRLNRFFFQSDFRINASTCSRPYTTKPT